MPLKRVYGIWILTGLLGVLPLRGQNLVGIGCPNQAAPGDSVSCSLVLSLSSGITVNSLTLGVAVTPNGGTPALTQGQLGFSDSVGGAFSSAGGTNNAISVVWFNLSSPLSDTVPLGSVSFAIPSDAVAALSYSATLTGASASQGNTVVSLGVGTPSVITIVPATVLSVSPNSGQAGQTLGAITITGQNSSFSPGLTMATFGTGITVDSLTVHNATTATVSITIAGNAIPGPRDVTLTTGGEVATLAGAFTVVAATCDVNIATSPDISIAQAVINQALGETAPNDLNGDGKVNVVDVQTVIDAVLGLGCGTGG